MPLGNAHLQLLAYRQNSAARKDSDASPMSFKPRSRLSSEDSTVATMASRSRITSNLTVTSEESTSDNQELHELQEKIEQLQLDYDEKCNELVECQNDLKATKMEVEELKILLKSQTGRASIVPEIMGTSKSGACDNPQAEELQRMFLWLSEQVVLEEPIRYNAQLDLLVAEQCVHMRDVVQWCLRDSDLRLTVPAEMAPEISNLIYDTKLKPSSLCGARGHAIMDNWRLSIYPAPSESTSAGTLLTNLVNQSTCLVANFPTPPPIPPLPVHQLSGFSLGDIVEVSFEGEWFRGVVKTLENDGTAQVHCDDDPPQVWTKTPMSFLRHPPDQTAPRVWSGETLS
eukprot:gnl/MRDRNA2_/MRDRNA2_105167_c0_seq1.p1 gnl/MRDRNA2_/MRDRNA2_105167_c0~~gnl/MRDRNA2_/MRDRNA2_105167_c0_seq1.p1  ORF type:complete len:343 (-),score=66.31 gnl/MRDRNA2_/MRDRNA2_105167_c0_seq1:572-1600(-)